jgi:hypothetical protein
MYVDECHKNISDYFFLVKIELNVTIQLTNCHRHICQLLFILDYHKLSDLLDVE